MTRIKRGVMKTKRKKKVRKLAKGFWGRRKNVYRTAVEAVENSLADAYIGRKEKKRQFRRLWITRINAAVKSAGLNYNKFIHGLKLAELDINRKILADLAVSEPDSFQAIVDKVKSVLDKK